MNEGAGTKSLGAWACPPARVARNRAVSGAGTTEFEAGSAAGGVWAMSCAHGRRARRARRTRVGFFMLHLLVDGPAGARPASKEIGVRRLERKPWTTVSSQCGLDAGNPIAKQTAVGCLAFLRLVLY